MTSSRELQPIEIDRAFCQRGRMAIIGRRLLAETVADLDAFDAALWVLSADGLGLECALHAGGTDPVIEQLSVPVAQSVVGVVASTGVAASIGPGDPHNRSIDERTGIETHAMAATPVYAGDRLCGVLSAINPRSKEVFSAQDLEKVQWKAYLMGLLLRDCHESLG